MIRQSNRWCCLFVSAIGGTHTCSSRMQRKNEKLSSVIFLMQKEMQTRTSTFIMLIMYLNHGMNELYDWPKCVRLFLSFCVCYVHVNNRRKYIWIYCRWTSFFRHAHFWSARLVGNWIAHLTQNKCVNGFSSKIKQNVIKMMSLHAVIHQTFRLPPAHLALAQIIGIFFFPVIAFFLILYHKFYSANSRIPTTFYTWGNSMKCFSTEFLVLNIKWIECEFNISAHAAKWRLRFMQIA